MRLARDDSLRAENAKSHAGKCRKFTCEHSKFWFCLKSWSDSEIKNTEYFNHNQKYLMWPHFIFPLNVLTQPSLNKSRLYILSYPYPIQNRSQPTCTFDVIFLDKKSITFFFGTCAIFVADLDLLAANVLHVKWNFSGPKSDYATKLGYLNRKHVYG